MTQRICSVEGCPRTAKSQLYCSGHQRRLEVHGDVRAGVPLRPKRLTHESVEVVLARADRDERTWCLNFPYGGKDGGRPNIWFEEKLQPAYVVAYKTWVGPIPDGLYICHHCDNGRCIEPSHLYAGTQKQNMADKINRGRDGSPRGEVSGVSIFTDDQVREIRRRRADGEYMTTLAREFRASNSTVKAICDGRTWRHLL